MGVQTSMRIVAVAGVVVLLAACGAKGSESATTTVRATAPGVTGGPARPSTGSLPALDSPAAAWRYSPPRPDQDQVRALETALGGTVTVAADAPQSWSFAPPAPAAPPSGGTDPQELAAGILTAIGWDPATLTMTVSPDGRTVTGVERLGGVPSPLPFLVTVDGSGRIAAASGHLDPPISVGDQPRIGTAAALGQLAGAPAGDDRGEHQPSPRPDPTPAVPPISPQPTTEPTVVDNLLRPPVGVAETYVPVPALDGGAWLLPAYRFTFDDGTVRTVLAVTGTPETSPTADPSPLVGLAEAQAAAAAASHGWTFRVAERDGVSELLTADYSPTRVNVAIANGAVSRAWMG